MNRRRVLLIAAALVAVLGVALVFVYVRGADARAQQQVQTTMVLTAITQIDPGETMAQASASGQIQQSAVTSGQVLPNAVVSTDELADQAALTTIYPGEQIIADKFGTAAQASSQTSLQIPKGMMAISVDVPDPQRVAGFVNPGAEVAVFFNGNDPTTQQTISRALLPRVQVLGVGATTPVSATADPAADPAAAAAPVVATTLLTLALSQEDAQRILFAQANGTLTFALLGAGGSVAAGPGVDFKTLFG